MRVRLWSLSASSVGQSAERALVGVVGPIALFSLLAIACTPGIFSREDGDPGVVPPSNGRFSWPVRGVIFSPYGMRGGRLHAGLDISAPEGTPVRASAAGIVTYSDSTFRGYGNMVLVDHGNGFVTAYAHNSENLVSPGTRVARGEVIALVGATGNATGPHVHFEIRRRGKTVDPRPYLGR